MPSPDQTTPSDPTRTDRQPATEQQQDPPGLTTEMDPTPDHGEDGYVGSGRLEGRRAIITGADSGIGRAVAIAYAREGCDVLFTHLPEEAGDAAETSRWITDAGRTGVAVAGDLTDEAFTRSLPQQAVDELGGLDIVVNNAARQWGRRSGIEELTTDELVRTYQTNVFALVWLVQASLPHLSSGASIINVSSIQAVDPSPPLIDYASTKAAIVNLTKCLATELAERGIRVNAVAPGPIWTPLIPATLPAEKVAEFGEDTPLGRVGQPAELAPAFVFFGSGESSYVTGEVLAVTGGRLLSA